MSIPVFIDGETELDSLTFNPMVSRINGIVDGTVDLPLAGIEGALGAWSGFVNAHDHGALGNETLDDVAGLRAAVAATPTGGTLYVPGGGRTYLMKNDTPYTKGILVDKPMRIVSDGAKMLAHEDSPDGIRMFEIVGTEDVTVEGFAFDPNGITGATCTYVKNASFVRIVGNHFDDPKSGGMLLGGNATDIQFQGNRVRGPGYGVLANDEAGTARVMVSHNTFDGEGGDGDAIEFNAINHTHHDIICIGNTITNYVGSTEHRGFGIGYARVHRGVIQGNTIDTVNRAGIHLECLCDGVIIRGNTVVNCDHAGIEVQGESAKACSDIIIDGNFVKNCAINPSLSDVLLGRGGIDIGFSVGNWLFGFGAKQVIVSNNIVDGCQGAGIYLTSVTNSSISGNIIRNISGDSVDQVHAIENVGIHTISCDRSRFIGNFVVDNQTGEETTYYPYYYYGSAVDMFAYGNGSAGTLAGLVDATTGVARALGSEVSTLGVRPGKLGFFATAPIVKPTGVSVDAAGIHAALVSLGLISA